MSIEEFYYMGKYSRIVPIENQTTGRRRWCCLCCGGRVAKKDKFCKHCGAKFDHSKFDHFRDATKMINIKL